VHRHAKIGHPGANGFIEGLDLTGPDEFFWMALRRNPYGSGEARKAVLTGRSSTATESDPATGSGVARRPIEGVGYKKRERADIPREAA
jgi:hypothetical protein